MNFSFYIPKTLKNFLQAAKMAGASDIVGVDLNESKFELAKTFGADFCINPKTCSDGDGRSALLQRHKCNQLLFQSAFHHPPPQQNLQFQVQHPKFYEMPLLISLNQSCNEDLQRFDTFWAGRKASSWTMPPQ